MAGGTLQLRDNGAGSNGTLAYGNNVIVQGAGGTVNVDRVNANSGNTFQLGTLQIGAQTLNVTGANGYGVRFGATTLTGAPTFNPTTAAATLGGVVSGAFGITKAGAGTLAMSAANTYSGTTNIQAGTLQLSGAIANSPRIDINAGATFDVAGVPGGFTLGGTQTLAGAGSVLGTVTVANGGHVEPGSAAGTGTLTMSGLTFANSANVRFVGTSSAVTNINVTGLSGLVANGGAGSVTLELTGVPGVGQQTLIDYSGAIGGTGFGAFTLSNSGRVLGTLVNNAGNTSIDVNVTGVDLPVWTGLLSSEWSTATLAAPKNWELDTGNTATDFITGDRVLFDDSGTRTTVDISVTDVAPTEVCFANATKNFTISGSKAITGTGTFVKDGTGTVTINNVNSFTGPVTLNAGTVEVATVANSGTASALGSGSLIAFNGGTLKFTGATGSTNRAIALDVGGATVQTDTQLTLAGAITGSATLNKTGAGTLIISGANSYLDTMITSGTLQVGAGGAAGTLGTGDVTNEGILVFNRSNDFTVTGVIQGGGSVTKLGAGTVTLGGATDNTYSGVTTVTAGTIVAGKPAGVIAIPGDLILETGAAGFRYNGNNVSNQIADTASITINGGTFGDPAATPTNPGATDTVANVTVSGGAFNSGRNSTVGPFTITGLLQVNAGVARAQRAGIISANAVGITGGSVDLDGGSTTGGSESRLDVGSGGLTLAGGAINFNAGPSALAGGSQGSILDLGGDVTSTGTSSFVRMNALVVAKALVDLGGSDRTFNVGGTLKIGTADAPLTISNGGIIKTGSGTLEIAGSQTLNSLAIDGGTLLLPEDPLVPAPEALSDQGAPLVAEGGALAAGSLQTVPEPGSLSLLFMGALGLLGRRRRVS